MKLILRHLDKIFFGSGAMLLFKYPLYNSKIQQLRKEIKDETSADEQEADLEDDEVEVLAYSRLVENGLTDDAEKLECEDYTDEEIQNDMMSIDWESAYE